MLTPQEVVSIKFQKAVFGGYDMTAVDDFLETLADDYSNLYKDSAVLKSKIKVLVEKVEEYRATEDAMRMALLTAQRMGDDLVRDATEKSERMVSEAETTARARIEQLRHEVEFEENRLIRAQQTVAAYIDNVQMVLAQHMGALEGIMTAETPATPAEPPAPAAPPPSEEEIIEDTAAAIEESVSRLLMSDLNAAVEGEADGGYEDDSLVEGFERFDGFNGAAPDDGLGLEGLSDNPYAPAPGTYTQQTPPYRPAEPPAARSGIDDGETRVWNAAEVNAAQNAAMNAARFEDLQFGANYNPEEQG